MIMLPERVEKLRQEYTGELVEVDTARAELVRFAGMPGRVKTINFNGRALVQFEGAGAGWYDVELDDLKVLDQAEPEPAEASTCPAPAEKPASPAKTDGKEKLSRLELARLEKEAAKSTACESDSEQTAAK